MKSSIYHLYKEPNLESHFCPNVDLKIFLVGYTSTFVASYHYVEFQEKRMIQTQENGEKAPFGLISPHLSPNLSCQYFFQNLALPLDITVAILM